MPGNANHWAAVCTVKTEEETKRGQTGHRLWRNVLERTWTKKENQNNKKKNYLVQHLPLWNQADESAFVKQTKKKHKSVCTARSSSSDPCSKPAFINNMTLTLLRRSKLTRVISATIVLVSRNQFLSVQKVYDWVKVRNLAPLIAGSRVSLPLLRSLNLFRERKWHQKNPVRSLRLYRHGGCLKICLFSHLQRWFLVFHPSCEAAGKHRKINTSDLFLANR